MNAPLTADELSHVLHKAKCNKASGIDGIPVELYKYGTDDLHNSILALFNYVFQSGKYPDVWSQGIINPVYKTGEKRCPDNYRKITLLSSLGELFDFILNNRFCFCKRRLKLIIPWFKQGSRTTDKLFMIKAIIDKYHALKRPVFLCYLDFKSVFDYINRHGLLFKLMTQGFTAKILRDLFGKAKSRVKLNSKIGELFENKCDVLQGGTIKPHVV